jgi:hypothetical protein
MKNTPENCEWENIYDTQPPTEKKVPHRQRFMNKIPLGKTLYWGKKIEIIGIVFMVYPGSFAPGVLSSFLTSIATFIARITIARKQGVSAYPH